MHEKEAYKEGGGYLRRAVGGSSVINKVAIIGPGLQRGR